MDCTLELPTKFDRLEAEIAALPPGEAEIVHHFAPGVYARQMNLLPGTVLTGKIHKGETLNIVCGDITVFNEIEGSRRRLQGFHIFKSPAGTRRAGIVHAFTTWVCIHPTVETDLAKIEAEVIRPYQNPLLTGQRQEVLS